MFQALSPILKTCDLTLHMHMERDGQIRVSAVPKRPDARQESFLFQPFSVIGTPQALDQQFVALVQSYEETREDLAVQMGKVTEQMKTGAETAKQARAGAGSGTKATGQGATGKSGAGKSQVTGRGEAAASTGPAKQSPSAAGTKTTSTAQSADTSQSAGGAYGAGAPTRAAARVGARTDTAKGAPGSNGLSGDALRRWYEEVALAGQATAALRGLARELLPADEQAKLTRCNAATLRAKIARFLAATADDQGQLPGELQTRLDRFTASATQAA